MISRLGINVKPRSQSDDHRREMKCIDQPARSYSFKSHQLLLTWPEVKLERAGHPPYPPASISRFIPKAEDTG